MRRRSQHLQENGFYSDDNQLATIIREPLPLVVREDYRENNQSVNHNPNAQKEPPTQHDLMITLMANPVNGSIQPLRRPSPVRHPPPFVP
uniref:Uncharacterized protein n=1 Tax=Cannabis sativa TaxID=3483 RepID=A0A803NH66_CANSA